MSESRTKGENDFKSEAKYKQFSSAIEKALRTFEGLTEWHDLISCLARTNKVCDTAPALTILDIIIVSVFYYPSNNACYRCCWRTPSTQSSPSN